MNLQALDIFSKEVAHIEGQIDQVNDQLAELQSHKRNVLLQAIHAIYDVKIGDIVEAKFGSVWDKAKVISLCTEHGWVVDHAIKLSSKPWLMVARICKDGTPSLRVTHAYQDWRVINNVA